MPAIPKKEATERLARAIEKAPGDDLSEVYAELFPTKAPPQPLPADFARNIAAHVRSGIEPEEIVDLWNVVFPADHNVYYDEEDDVLRYNEPELRYVEQ